VLRPVTALDCWIIWKYVVRMGGGWNWLRIMSNGGGISSIEPKDSAGREFNSKEGTGQAQIIGFLNIEYL
jgi:hypothetical protein